MAVDARSFIFANPAPGVTASRPPATGAAKPIPSATPAIPQASAAAKESAPLFEAVSKGERDKVAALLDLGADPNITNPGGMPALIAAIRGHFTAIAALLIAKGANLEARDIYGCTPFLSACGIRIRRPDRTARFQRR